MLRAILVAIGVLLLVSSAFAIRGHGILAAYATVQLVAGGILLSIVGLFEARRYGSNKTSTAGAWEATGERFVDPTTGRLTEVRYNASTGEREYRDVE